MIFIDFSQIDGILAAVDCTKEQSLAKRYDISGFPTGSMPTVKGLTFYRGGGRE